MGIQYPRIVIPWALIPCESKWMATAQRTIMVFLLPAIAGIAGGCLLIPILGSPAAYDIKVPAEFELKQRSDKRIAVFVESTWSAASPSLNSELAAAIRAELIKKASIQSDFLFVSGEASPARAKSPIDFRLLSPSQIAREGGAGTILYVRIEEFQMTQLHREGYFTGHLMTRSMIFDDGGTQLWPPESSGRLIRTRVEVNTKGSDATRMDLIDATTHCISRYMYNCPKTNFNTKFEEIDYTKEEYWD